MATERESPIAIRFPSGEEMYEKLTRLENPRLIGISSEIDDMYKNLTGALAYMNIYSDALALSFRLHMKGHEGRDPKDKATALFVYSHIDEFISATIDDPHAVEDIRRYLRRYHQEELAISIATHQSKN